MASSSSYRKKCANPAQFWTSMSRRSTRLPAAAAGSGGYSAVVENSTVLVPSVKVEKPTGTPSRSTLVGTGLSKSSKTTFSNSVSANAARRAALCRSRSMLASSAWTAMVVALACMASCSSSEWFAVFRPACANMR